LKFSIFFMEKIAITKNQRHQTNLELKKHNFSFFFFPLHNLSKPF